MVLAITIAPETPLQDEVRILVAALNDTLIPLSPLEFQYKLTVEEMADPSVTVLVARDGSGKAVGIGALKDHGDGTGEVKRMYTPPVLRGQRVGARILARIEALARDKGLAVLMLETGEAPGFEEAYRLYERGGYTRRGAFFDYPDSGWSRFYEKALG
ncbi:MAG: GNAT family N-acetyltransferase [Bauldia sp.]|nr:GNAT family N-acetyltransferase [Bauldia sp.]